MPSPIPFRVVKRELAAAGWRLDRIAGSHHYFVKEGEQPISIPVHRNEVKFFYVREYRKIIAKGA